MEVLRTKANRTQKSVAAAVRCSDTLICGSEQGTHWPGRDMAAKLAKVLPRGTSLVTLWDRLNSKRSYPDWASDLVKANNSLGSARDVDELVSGRMARQEVWNREAPPG
ncbi:MULTISPECIES: helix-turn-helix transcriptional regulator [unclassified Nocardiopsis]|uniref:helix-turn-helix domain-containing protein n=1 Tax=unclassified Nocardiopsis TaxID=2649073 RepID=UPI001F35BB67|nr:MULTISPECIES: helix-turn-helix transcriptional regulator [unclassified Nocardiopsis]